MFFYSLEVIDEPKMSEIRVLNLCHKKSILVDIYRKSLLTIIPLARMGFESIANGLLTQRPLEREE